MYRKLFTLVSLVAVLSMLAACAAPQPTAAPAAPAAAAPAAAAPAAAAKTYKMAAIFPGVITDADYNTLAYLGLTAVKADLGVDTAYSESVAVPDVERVMREYIDGGYNIIWTHGGQFITQTTNLAKQFPDVTFIGEGDAEVKDMPTNMWMIDRNFHTGYYAIGYLAAKASKTGKIGYIAGQTLPFSYAEVHAMQQAFKDNNLKVEFKPVWTGDFNDPTKGRQVADAMIAEGIDVIVCSLNLGVFGVFEAVKAVPDKNILVTAKYIDKSSFAPKNYITSLLYDFKGPMVEIVSKIQKGEKGQYYSLGFQTGVSIQKLTNVDASLSTDVDGVVNDIKSGKVKVVKDVTAIK
jgi:basic membrane protein A and related proteins